MLLFQGHTDECEASSCSILFDINLVTSAIILIKSPSAAVEINETTAPVVVCTEFLAFAHLNLYMVHLAVPIKGLMRMMTDR